MTLPHFQKSLCGCSLKTGTLIIGWFYFIQCMIPFLVCTLFGISGKIVLNRAIDDALTKESDYKLGVDKPVSSFMDESTASSFMDYDEETAKNFMNDTPATEFKNNTSDLERITLGYVSAIGNGSIIIIFFIGLIFAVGATFNALLLVGGYNDQRTPIVFWMTEQMILFVFDVGSLVVTILYCGPTTMIMNSLRIGLSVYCMLIVNSHLHNLKYRGSSKSIAYKPTKF